MVDTETIKINMDNQIPKMNMENVSLIETKIKINEANENDFQDLQTFISAIGGKNDFLLERLKINGFNGFKEYILVNRKDSNNQNVRAVKGFILGVISVIKDYIQLNGL